MDSFYIIIFMISALLLLILSGFVFASLRSSKSKKLNSWFLVSIFVLLIIYLLSDLIFYLNDINIINEFVFKYLTVTLVLLLLFAMLLFNTISSFKILNVILLVIILVISSLFIVSQPRLEKREIVLQSSCTPIEKVTFTLDDIYLINGVGPWHKHFYSSASYEQIKDEFKSNFDITEETSNTLTYKYEKGGNKYSITLSRSTDKKVFILNGFKEGSKYTIIIGCNDN